jgi:hypothetical protein
MFIKLTNATKPLDGQDILVNLNLAVSIYRGSRIDENENEDQVTYIFMPPHGNWEVKETLDEIAKLIKGTKDGK